MNTVILAYYYEFVVDVDVDGICIYVISVSNLNYI
jgi:hypothetical protein